MPPAIEVAIAPVSRAFLFRRVERGSPRRLEVTDVDRRCRLPKGLHRWPGGVGTGATASIWAGARGDQRQVFVRVVSAACAAIPCVVRGLLCEGHLGRRANSGRVCGALRVAPAANETSSRACIVF